MRARLLGAAGLLLPALLGWAWLAADPAPAHAPGRKSEPAEAAARALVARPAQAVPDRGPTAQPPLQRARAPGIPPGMLRIRVLQPDGAPALGARVALSDRRISAIPVHFDAYSLKDYAILRHGETDAEGCLDVPLAAARQLCFVTIADRRGVPATGGPEVVDLGAAPTEIYRYTLAEVLAAVFRLRDQNQTPHTQWERPGLPARGERLRHFLWETRQRLARAHLVSAGQV